MRDPESQPDAPQFQNRAVHQVRAVVHKAFPDHDRAARLDHVAFAVAADAGMAAGGKVLILLLSTQLPLPTPALRCATHLPRWIFHLSNATFPMCILAKHFGIILIFLTWHKALFAALVLKVTS